MHLITLDRLEPTLAKVILGRCRQKIELAKTTCGQPVEQLPHDATAEAVAAIVGQHCDRSNQGRKRVRLRTAAADHFFAFARDEKRPPVLVHARDRKLVRFEDCLDGRHVASVGRSDVDLFHVASMIKKNAAHRAASGVSRDFNGCVRCDRSRCSS